MSQSVGNGNKIVWGVAAVLAIMFLGLGSWVAAQVVEIKVQMSKLETTVNDRLTCQDPRR